MKHVTFHLPSFLRRVRIHGGEFDSSARAMNREEQVRLLQAEPRIVRGSTIERKQMSTKTTFKRIALVTVAALGFGALSVVPSNAVASAVDFSVSAATASQLTGETATATSVVATLSYQASQTTDSVTVTASLFSAKNPDGTNMTTGVAQPNLDVNDTTTAQVYSGGVSTLVLKAANGGAAIANDTAANVVPTATGGVVVKLRVFLNAPTKAGTYVVRLTPTLASGSTAGSLQSAAAQTVTITVTAAPADDLVAASATSIISAGETNSATADVTVTSTRTPDATLANTVAAATIKVSLLNKSALAANESFTASLSGPGILGAAAPGTSNPVLDEANPTARILTVKNGDVVQVFPDGTSGVATITIASLLGVELAKETVTFFGAPATVVTTVKKAVIGVGTATDALEVVVKDSAGVSVSNLTKLSVVSSDTTKIANAYDQNIGSYSATTGSYLIQVTAAAAGAAKLTVSTKASATATTGVDAASVDIRVGSSTPASVAVTLDKASYAPGEKATISISLKDATGLDLAAGNYASIFAAGGIAANYTLGGGSDTTTATYVNGYTAGAATYTVYMPVTEGDVVFSWTTGSVAATSGAGLATANQAVKGSVTVSVSSPSTAAATDAANEATDAANAATDAALAAAEAADAATTAAQEASDAVAALSASVTKLIAGLQSQIKSLAAVVAKIAKKVRA
jgi:trimeric autotransporter adhesin